MNTKNACLCQKCQQPIDALTLSLLGDQAQYCTRCETTWELKTTLVPGGSRVWEETPSGRRQSERLWWHSCRHCDQGWYQGHQCYQCRTRLEHAQQGVLHESGAVKIPRGFSRSFLWFPDCQHCQGGYIFIPHHFGGSEKKQCHECDQRYEQWLNDHCLMRYVVLRTNYPYKVRIDTTKKLTKSRGKFFYMEVCFY